MLPLGITSYLDGCEGKERAVLGRPVQSRVDAHIRFSRAGHIIIR
jgi:hypothetical protein